MELISETSCTLMELYAAYEEGNLILPDHQRDDIWTETKKKRWEISIMSQKQLPGCIMTYELEGSKTRYLNDGAQRVIYATGRFVQNCRAKGIDYKDVLYKVKILTQHIKYEDVAEAVQHFYQVNFGTTATPLELTKCLFVEMLPNYKKIWEPVMNSIHTTMSSALGSLGCSIPDVDDPVKRTLVHKRKRDDLHLFYRFISGDDTTWSPKVGAAQIDMDKWQNETQLERRLIDIFQNSEIQDVKRKLLSFDNFVKEHVALYKREWLKEHKYSYAPSNVAVRWWLAVAIYRKNNSFDIEVFKSFTKKLISHSDGKTSVFYRNKEGKQKNCNTAMARLNNLSTILIALNMNSSDFQVVRRDSPKQQLIPGFCNSHKKSFRPHGNGETLPEDSLSNRARGNRDMTEEEIQDLEQ